MADLPDVNAGPLLRWVVAIIVVAACAGFAWAMFRVMGAVGLVMSAPLWGVLLAVPLVSSFGAGARVARYLRWRRVAGRYYEHRGHWVDVVEDEAGQRFVRLAHVRRILPGWLSDAGCVQRFAGRTLERGGWTYLRDDALMEALAPAQAEPASKLRQWLAAEVAGPGERRRERG